MTHGSLKYIPAFKELADCRGDANVYTSLKMQSITLEIQIGYSIQTKCYANTEKKWIK